MTARTINGRCLPYFYANAEEDLESMESIQVAGMKLYYTSLNNSQKNENLFCAEYLEE